MNIRVTPQVLINEKLANIQQQYARIGDLNIQASSGKKLNRVSDDPVASIISFNKEAASERLDGYQKNINEATTKLNLSVAALTEVGKNLTQARDLALQAANSTNDPSAQLATSNQVNALLDQVFNLANTQSGDQYLYAGTAVSTPPFTAVGGPGQRTAVSYQGASERANAPIGVTLSVDTLYKGSEIFQTSQRGATTINGTTGAKPGTGTDSATGQGTLIVTHTATTYAGASGVQAGTNSVAGDTVLGLAGANTLTINDTSGTGASGTVSLNGGPAVAYTSANTNLQVQGPNGETVFLNTTAITAGFNGSVNIAGAGTVSVDGGLTSTALTFNANQVVTNSQTGAVTNIDTTAVKRPGTDNVNYSGTYDVFQILIALRDDLKNAANLPAAQQEANIRSRIDELNRLRTDVLTVVGVQSGDLQALDNLENQISALKLQTNEDLSKLQSADIPDVVLRLQEQQNLLQLTLSTTARLFDLNLLNFLR